MACLSTDLCVALREYFSINDLAMPPLPPLNALKTFESAARHLSFAHAATELHVTPGAVSRQVKALEDWLGGALFQRRHRQVDLTPLGRSYLDAVSGPLARIAEATERALAGRIGRPLAICSYPTFALRWLVPRWGRFYDRHPDIDIQLTTSLNPVDFERDPFDAAVRVGEVGSTWPGLDTLPLADVVLSPVCSPALLDGPRPLRTIDDLRHHTRLHGAPRPRDWERWFEAVGEAPVPAASELTFDTLNLVIEAAIAGLGVAIGIRALIADDLAAGRLVQPFPQARVSRRPFQLVWPKSHGDDPRLAAYLDWLRTEVATG